MTDNHNSSDLVQDEIEDPYQNGEVQAANMGERIESQPLPGEAE